MRTNGDNLANDMAPAQDCHKSGQESAADDECLTENRQEALT